MDDEVPGVRALFDQLRSDPRLRDAIGVRVGPQTREEIEHFYICKACGQPVDMRDPGQVLHHEEQGHAPLAVEEETRLLRISDQLRAALATKERPE